MHTSKVESLKNKINEMVKITQDSITVTIEALSAFCNTKHNYKNIAKYSHTIEDFVKSANALKNSVRDVMQMVDNTIKKIMTYISAITMESRKTSSNSYSLDMDKFVKDTKETLSSIKNKTEEITNCVNRIPA